MSEPNAVLVTGASGFVGGALVRALAADFAGVRGLTRSVAGPGSFERFVYRGFDDAEAIARALDGVSAIVHAAGPAHLHGRLDAATCASIRRDIVDGTVRVFDAAARAGAERFVFISSVAAAAVRSETPLADNAAPRPISVYGRGKLEAEQALRGRPGPRLVILRPPLVYGPGMKGNPLLLLRALRTGLPLPLKGVRNARSILHIDNLADAVGRSLAGTRLDPAPYFVADRGTVSTTEFATSIAEGLGVRPLLFRLPERARLARRLEPLFASLVVDSSRFESDAGFAPAVASIDGLRATGASYARARGGGKR